MIDSFYIYIIPVLFLVIGYLVGIMLSKNKIKSESDKIIKLDSGRILQIGTPKEVLG